MNGYEIPWGGGLSPSAHPAQAVVRVRVRLHAPHRNRGPPTIRVPVSNRRGRIAVLLVRQFVESIVGVGGGVAASDGLGFDVSVRVIAVAGDAAFRVRGGLQTPQRGIGEASPAEPGGRRHVHEIVQRVV